nr:Gag-Pol polyprotein [Tanacetum cinerariifolium]
MDLCRPMSVKIVNGKKYILIIVDDYSRFTWVKCLRSKDETLDFIIKFLKMIQVRLKRQWLPHVTPKSFIVRIYHGNTPYELLHEKLHDLSFLYVFGALCYLSNDSESLGKLQPKADIAPEVIAPIVEVVASEPAASTSSPSSTTVDQDAPSPLDPTMFIYRNGNDLLPVQIYVDDIIFAASTPELGIFINQSKYALESLKKYGFESYDPVDTPMVEKSKMDEDKEGKAADLSHYHGSAYRKALTYSKKDLSIPTRNRQSGST